LERIRVPFVLHIPTRHVAQFGIHALRQLAQSSLVTAVPGSQQIRDFSRAFVYWGPGLLLGPRKYTRNLAAFDVRLRLYQRKENKLFNDLLQRQ